MTASASSTGGRSCGTSRRLAPGSATIAEPDATKRARPYLVVPGKQRLHAGRRKRVGHEPAGRIDADPPDDRRPRPEPGGGKRDVRRRPARPQLDPPVDALSRDQLGQRGVEQHVADGDQVEAHPGLILTRDRNRPVRQHRSREHAHDLRRRCPRLELSQAEADPTLELLLEHGVNHIDIAASYGDSELRLAPWLARNPGRFFLATKTGERDYEGAREEIRRSLERLGVDHVDLIQLHNLVDVIEWEFALREGGALEAAVEARDEGLVRFIGVTGHGLTVARMHRRSLERFPFDSVLAPYNYVQMRDARLCSRLRGARCRLRRARRRLADDQEHRARAMGRPRADRVDLVRAAARSGRTSTSPCTGCSAGPSVFLNTVGDVTLLPKVLDAASRFASQPPDEAMDDLVARSRLVPLFS